MILTIEILSIWLALAVIVALVAAPSLARRFRRNDRLLAEHRAWLDAHDMPRQD